MTGLFEERVIVGDIPLSEGPTIYNRIGDWPVWLALALLVALIFQAKFLPYGVSRGALVPERPDDDVPETEEEVLEL